MPRMSRTMRKTSGRAMRDTRTVYKVRAYNVTASFGTDRKGAFKHIATLKKDKPNVKVDLITEKQIKKK